MRRNFSGLGRRLGPRLSINNFVALLPLFLGRALKNFCPIAVAPQNAELFFSISLRLQTTEKPRHDFLFFAFASGVVEELIMNALYQFNVASMQRAGKNSSRAIRISRHFTAQYRALDKSGSGASTAAISGAHRERASERVRLSKRKLRK
jgi:hypothetical protein